MPEHAEGTVQFHLEQFEGPLDLLLALVSKNKMSLYDIEILTLIDQYLVVIEQTNNVVLENVTEFIGMAAHLVQMKSFLLLPKSEEAERMREELTGLLVEYSACKRIAGQLGEMSKGVYIAVRRPQVVDLDNTYTGHHTLKELTDAFALLMGRSNARRLPKQEQFEEIVAAPFVSVNSRVIHVLRGLVTGKVNKLRGVFAHCSSRGETVATFLAVLELIRGGRITVQGDGEIVLQKGRSVRARTQESREESPAWN